MLLLLLLIQLPFTIAYNNGLGKTPPMGWNSWCTDSLCNLLGKDPCSEKMVQNTVLAMKSNGLYDLGYNYVALDDCWSDTKRDDNGFLQADVKKFPNGMKAVADFVHSHDMLFGLYTSLGDKTCKGNRPGSFNHYIDDAQTLTAWGIDMIKMDHCGSKTYSNGTTGTDPQLYGAMSSALNATGRPVLFSLCSWGLDSVWKWGSSIAQMYRIQMDHLPFWKFSGNRSSGAGLGQGTYDIINWMGELQPSNWTKQYGWMDPDFLMTEYFTMDYISSRTEFTFWCLWSSPLLISTDLINPSSKKLEIITNTEVIAINQDASNTAGDRIYLGNNGEQIWSRPLANGDVCVVLYNSANGRMKGDAVTISIDWKMLPEWKNVVDIGSVEIRDLWDKKNLGSFMNGFNATLQARDVKMLRLKRAGV